MFAFLKAPPDAAPISDKRELDARYRYWRRHILLTIWLGYALFYFTRKSGNDSNLLIVFYVQIVPDDFVMQLHRF